jgi:DNA-binding IclR family transcriptional regulator
MSSGSPKVGAIAMLQESGDNSGRSGPQSVDRAMRLLATLAAQPHGISLADLAREIGLPLSTTHRLLTTLSRRGLVRETSDGLRALGPATVILAGAFLEGLDLRTEARRVMEQVVDESGETCHLAVLVAAHTVYIEKVDSRYPVRMVSRIGGTSPAVMTAMGRAILAHTPDSVVESTVAASETVLGLRVERREFAHRLADVRRNGFSSDIEENEIGICCVGAPVFDHTGSVVAAMSISVPAGRFDPSRTETMGQAIRRAANAVSAALGWNGGQMLEGAGLGNDPSDQAVPRRG